MTHEQMKRIDDAIESNIWYVINNVPKSIAEIKIDILNKYNRERFINNLIPALRLNAEEQAYLRNNYFNIAINFFDKYEKVHKNQNTTTKLVQKSKKKGSYSFSDKAFIASAFALGLFGGKKKK